VRHSFCKDCGPVGKVLEILGAGAVARLGEGGSGDGVQLAHLHLLQTHRHHYSELEKPHCPNKIVKEWDRCSRILSSLSFAAADFFYSFWAESWIVFSFINTAVNCSDMKHICTSKRKVSQNLNKKHRSKEGRLGGEKQALFSWARRKSWKVKRKIKSNLLHLIRKLRLKIVKKCSSFAVILEKEHNAKSK